MSGNVIHGPFYNSGFYDTGAGGGSFSGTIFKTDCLDFENNRDIPVLGYCRDLTALSNNFSVLHNLNYYSFSTTSAATESGDIWMGAPMLIYGKKTTCKIKTSLSGSKSKSWQILTPLPARISYFDYGLNTNVRNSIGIALNTSRTYSTNSSKTYNSGNNKHIGLQELELDKIYEVVLTFENGTIRASIDDQYVQFDYDYFNADSPSWMGGLVGTFGLRQNSGSVDSGQKINIHQIEVSIE